MFVAYSVNVVFLFCEAIPVIHYITMFRLQFLSCSRHDIAQMRVGTTRRKTCLLSLPNLRTGEKSRSVEKGNLGVEPTI